MFQIYRAIDRSPPIIPNPGLLFMASTFATVPDLLLVAYLGLQVDAGCGAQVQVQYGVVQNLISIGNCWSANTEKSEYPFYSRRNRGSS